MKRILVAIDANQVNVNMLDFACFIAKLTHSKLTGIFLDKIKAEEPLKEMAYVALGEPAGTSEKVKLFDEGARLFTNACNNRGANCSLHHDEGSPVVDIIIESRFAELLIVDPEMSFKEKKEVIPSGFIKEVLTKSECPVVLAPFSFYGIDEIIFAYDGSPASVFAIKQFIYLFPEFTEKKVTVLQVNEHGDNAFTEKNKIGELLQMHFSSIGFQSMHGKADDEIFGYLLGKKNVFVVMGAFGRSMLSGFFKHSTAELILKTINLPVFIAHHK
jgi:nucleotide-binding universal stress UspA family protein